MAQRDKEEAKLHAHETLTLCVNNCGFPGNAATKNMCASCFQASAAAAASSPPRSCSPRSAPRIRSPNPAKPAEEEEAARAATEATRVAASPATPAKQANRCFSCRKRVGLTGFRCRCGELYCGEHRYSDRHECTFDYKATARAAIARANPVIRATKIVRI
ncbi:hypothetical protein Cni_G20824 [Canna indica]|uniref:Uncharacterized protein n=1 Tax=Canna indica TaxID=4628 RepID=A0AAQ3QL44_9LILI|nr:hypothetical protein Cni_G20824 [Canna indica]